MLWTLSAPYETSGGSKKCYVYVTVSSNIFDSDKIKVSKAPWFLRVAKFLRGKVAKSVRECEDVPSFLGEHLDHRIRQLKGFLSCNRGK